MYLASELQEILRLFGLAPRGFREITSGSNWMGRRYAIETDTGKLFLKVRSEWWPNAQAEYVCGLLEYLESRGFPVPSLYRTTEGQPFGVWNGHICECYEFIEGKPYAIGDLDQISAAAQQLANFHSLTRDYPPPGANLGQDVGYPTPERIGFFAERVHGFLSSNPETISAIEQSVDAFFNVDRNHDSNFPRSNAVVHGDYHPGNLIFDGEAVVAVCDFDLAQAVPRAFDLAYFLYRTAGEAVRSGGGIARLNQPCCQVFQKAYHRYLSDTMPPVKVEEIASELLRFAWYDTLLTANNSRDSDTFLLWFSDTQALSRELGLWREL